MSRHYPNPPIRDVVCEFRFEEDGHWDGAAPGLIYAAMSDDFPRRWAVENPVPPSVPARGSPSTVPPALQQLELRFGPPEGLRFWRSTDESGFFSVGPYRLSIHHFAPYPSWKSFSETIDKGFRSYRDVLNPTKVQRIGLRYINAIDLGQSRVSLEDCFDFYPFVGNHIPQDLSGFHCRVQILFEDKRDALTLQMWQAPRPEGESVEVILDLDYFLAQPNKLELDQTTEWLETGHSNVERVFEGCLKDPTRMLFQ